MYIFRHLFSIAGEWARWHRSLMALKDGKKGITAYIPPELLKRVKIYGLMSDLTLTEIVIDALTEYLNQKGVPDIQIPKDSESKSKS